MNSVLSFANAAAHSAKLSTAIATYKSAAQSPDGYLNSPIFRRMRDGTDDKSVKRFFAAPFAEVRTWLPEMFGVYISRFPDHPYTYVIVDNLSDEYGKYVGERGINLSHAQLYRYVLDELGIEMAKDTMSTPAQATSQAAKNFYQWFKNETTTKQPAYLLGHFLAYEITDTIDFPDFLTAAKRIWPHSQNIHEFFIQHVRSEHDSTFARDLQPLFEQGRQTMVEAMANLLTKWTAFYQEAALEI